MNYKMTRYILGKMFGVEAIIILLPAIVSWIYKEESGYSFLISSAILLLIYLCFGRKKPENTTIYTKDGLIIVSAAWVLWSVFGALPFYISGSVPNYIDAFFETVSGFTATGSTVIGDVSKISKGINFWRCLTLWIGGMGVLIFVMVITSLHDKNSMHLMRAEVPGPELSKLVPKVRTTAKILYGMYFALTVILVVFLLAGGMDLYDSITHAFSTAGTGGFNNRTNSIAFYNSIYIEIVITVFMILFGINFNLYYLFLFKKVKNVWKDEEVRAYFIVIIVATVLIAMNIFDIYGTVFQSLRYALFQVASTITTTGFATDDFNLWPEFSKSMILIVGFIGSCAGSTGGGIKVARLLILLKSIKKEIAKMIHPKSIRIIKINGKKINEETIHGVYMYMIAYVFILIISVLIVSLDNFDFATSFSGVLSAINNGGLGISKVGPSGNFSQFSVLSKVVLCLDMLIGRLEIFPFLMLLSPNLWRKKF